MNHHRNVPSRWLRRDGRWHALQRLDEALERNSGGSNAKKIQVLGRLMFGDLWDEEGADADSAEKPE